MSEDTPNPEIEALQASIAKLEANNKRLTDELKIARKSAEISPDQLAAVEAERDKLQADLVAAQKQAKDATKAAETATKSLADEQGFTQKLLIDNGLLETLGKNGVTNPVHQKAAVAMLRSGVQIVIDGENRVAKVGDKLLADHVKEWAASDEGKFFVAAPNNTGGGANGGAQGGGGKTMTRTDFSAKSPADQMAHIKGGGTVTD